MATPFTDTPKIGVDINNPVPKESMPQSSHRAGSKIFGTDGKLYEFKIDANTGVGAWTAE